MNNNILPIGTLLNDGAYRIEEHLGSGGFGNTYKVTHVPSGKIFAAKEFFKSDINLRVGNTVTVSVPSNNATFESFKKKFVKEAQRMKTLNSQHIVRCTDVFPENGTYYYVMDFIDGESLQAYINRVGKLSKEKALSIFEQLLEALQVAHSQTPQLYHLDIKPANIMLDKKGNAYLIDFGASKLSSMEKEGVTSTSLFAYSKGYAPTELIEANSSRIGPWTDFYEMGALLHYMLMKKLPPTSSDLTNGEDFSFAADINKDIQKLIVWLMQPGTKKRPQSVKEIRNYLASGISEITNNNIIDKEETIIGLSPKMTIQSQIEATVTNNIENIQQRVTNDALPTGFVLKSPEAHYKILYVHSQLEEYNQIAYIAKQIYPKVIADKEYIIYESYVKGKDKRMADGTIASSDGIDVKSFQDWDLISKRNKVFAENSDVWATATGMEGPIKYYSDGVDNINCHRFVCNNTFYFAMKYNRNFMSNAKTVFWTIIITIITIIFLIAIYGIIIN